MSNPEDSCEELVASLRVNEPTTTTLTLSELPPELILRVASQLEVGDLLALRRSNRFIYSVTHDKLLWKDILRDLRLPLPRALRSRHLDDLSYPELEKAVLQSCMAEYWWLKRRDPDFTSFAREGHSNIRLLDFLDDRWVISIPAIGLPSIWDTLENPPKLCKLSESMLHSFQDKTIDALAAVDPCRGDIIIGLGKVRHTPLILRMHLAEPVDDSFQLTAYGTIDTLVPTIFALEPSRNMILTEIPDVGIQIGDWASDQAVQIITPRLDDDIFVRAVPRVSVTRRDVLKYDDQKPLLGLRLVGDYILIFRSNRIEMFPVPAFPDADGRSTSENENGPDSSCFYLKLPDGRFTGASFSEPQPNPESLDDSRIVYILAQSTTTGFFYFRVTVYNPDYALSGPRARMDVDLVGVHELRKPRTERREKLRPILALRSWLGPEGKRGVWIERPLSKLMNFVVAVSFDQSCPGAVPVESGDDLRELCEIAPRIESMGDVFIVESWSLHDDIVRCAFSEATGKIVLGTRDNRIILL